MAGTGPAEVVAGDRPLTSPLPWRADAAGPTRRSIVLGAVVWSSVFPAWAGGPVVIDGATRDAKSVSITIVYSDGRKRIERPATAGDTFDIPKLSDDRNTVGWSVDRMDGASYPYPAWLDFIAHGRRGSFACPQGMPWAWRFEGNARVVVECSYPHGPQSLHRVLFDIARQRVLGDVVVPEGGLGRTAPAWARRDVPDR